MINSGNHRERETCHFSLFPVEYSLLVKNIYLHAKSKYIWGKYYIYFLFPPLSKSIN